MAAINANLARIPDHGQLLAHAVGEIAHHMQIITTPLCYAARFRIGGFAASRAGVRRPDQINAEHPPRHDVTDAAGCLCDHRHDDILAPP